MKATPDLLLCGRGRVASLALPLDVFVAAFAAWTMLCHAVVLSGGSFRSLQASALTAAVGAVLLFCLLRLPAPPKSAAPTPPLSGGRGFGAELLWLLAAIGIGVYYFLSASFLIYWLLCSAFVAVLLLSPTTPRPAENAADPRAGPPARVQMAVLVSLVCVAVAVTLLSSRPDADDAYYLNVAIAALDAPHRELLAMDTMHGDPGLPPLATFYQAHTYELLVAFVAELSGIDAATVYYRIGPALFACLLVLAYWLLFRELVGAWAMAGVVVAVVALIAWGDAHRTYGNFAFVRLFQGKAVMVSLWIPAAMYYAARFTRRHDFASWLGMALTQTIAVGFSSSAIIVAPLAVAVTLLGAMRFTRQDLQRLVLGVGSSAYVVLLAATLFQRVAAHSLQGDGAYPVPAFGESIKLVLGELPRAALALAAVPLAAVLARRMPRPRMVQGMALMTLLLVLNPYASVVASWLVVNMSWRIYWAIPMALWIGLAGAGLAMLAAQRGRWRLGLVTALVYVAVFAGVPGYWTLSSQNHNAFGRFQFPVPAERDIAREVATLARDGYVLVPWQVSAWIPTLHRPPRVIAVRPNYVYILENGLGPPPAAERAFLTAFVSGAPQAVQPAAEQLGRWQSLLAAYQVDVIAVPVSHPLGTAVGDRLAALGYVRRGVPGYDLWHMAEGS